MAMGIGSDGATRKVGPAGAALGGRGKRNRVCAHRARQNLDGLGAPGLGNDADGTPVRPRNVSSIMSMLYLAYEYVTLSLSLARSLAPHSPA